MAAAESVMNEWLCGSCRSLNTRSAGRCPRCHVARAKGEISIEVRPSSKDSIPGLIEMSGKHFSPRAQYDSSSS